MVKVHKVLQELKKHNLTLEVHKYPPIITIVQTARQSAITPRRFHVRQPLSTVTWRTPLLLSQNFSSIQEQQMAGWMQVGAHGTGCRLPSVEEQIIRMQV